MKIYVGHAKKFDFKKELYEPLRKSPLNNEHEIVLPHEKDLISKLEKKLEKFAE
ncbi:hypothetical protein KY333_00525 [Candidatus Woesearchaeota archaeon]|nr:hypothetical protein [Candidatus Woesearchaeota archaeon]